MKRKISLMLFGLLSFQLFAQDFELLRSSQKQFSNKEWQLAAESLQKVVKENPYNGKYAYQLGWTYLNLDEFQKSIEQFVSAYNIGYNKAVTSYNAACSYARSGDQQNALIWLKRSLQNGLQDHEETVRPDPDLNGLHQLEEFKELFPDIGVELSREEGWALDIQYFKSKFELMHHDLFGLVDQKTWNNELNNLQENIANLTDDQIIVELMKLTSSIGAGHSYIIPPFQGKHHFHQLPIELYEFKDGIHIRKAKVGYEKLLGAKVLAIENTPIEKLIESVSMVANPENQIMKRWTSLFYITLTEILQHVDVAKSSEGEISVLIEKNGVEEKITLETDLFTPEIISSKSTPNGWVSLQNQDSQPRYLMNVNETFWYEYDKTANIVYAQINQIRNGQKQSLQEFGKEIANEAAKKKCALVLDLRLNNGGNGMLVKNFLLEIIQNQEVNQPGKLFTVIGRKTFSAANMLVNKLDEYSNTTFIGEPTGGKPSHVGDDNNFVLPYSGLIASAAMTYWQSAVSYDNREWLAPDIYVPMTVDDYAIGKDPIMEYIGEIVK